MVEQNLDALRLQVNVDTFQTMFADLVQLEASPENLKLHFLQKLPGSPEGGPNAKIVSSVVLTWSHFVRMTDLFTNTIAEQKGLVLDTLHSSFSEKSI